MDFLVHKFSEWLKTSKIPHELIKVKGGYILKFIEPSDDFKKLISSLFITIDTGERVNEISVKKPVNIFTSDGNDIVIDQRHYANIINTLFPVIRDYVFNKQQHNNATH